MGPRYHPLGIVTKVAADNIRSDDCKLCNKLYAEQETSVDEMLGEAHVVS